MYSTLSGDIAKLHQHEILSEASKRHEFHRVASQKKVDRRMSRTHVFVYKRALATVALSALFFSLLSGLALAKPAGPGPISDGSAPVVLAPTHKTVETIAAGQGFWAILAVTLVACGLYTLAVVQKRRRLSMG